MKIITSTILFFMSLVMSAQVSSLPKNAKKETNMYVVKKIDKWLKVLSKPSEKDILKVQEQLNYLDYKLVKTGVLDEQTKKQLKLFHSENDLCDFERLFFVTIELLKKNCKIKKKGIKKM